MALTPARALAAAESGSVNAFVEAASQVGFLPKELAAGLSATSQAKLLEPLRNRLPSLVADVAHARAGGDPARIVELAEQVRQAAIQARPGVLEIVKTLDPAEARAYSIYGGEVAEAVGQAALEKARGEARGWSMAGAEPPIAAAGGMRAALGRALRRHLAPDVLAGHALAAKVALVQKPKTDEGKLLKFTAEVLYENLATMSSELRLAQRLKLPPPKWSRSIALLADDAAARLAAAAPATGSSQGHASALIEQTKERLFWIAGRAPEDSKKAVEGVDRLAAELLALKDTRNADGADKFLAAAKERIEGVDLRADSAVASWVVLVGYVGIGLAALTALAGAVLPALPAHVGWAQLTAHSWRSLASGAFWSGSAAWAAVAALLMLVSFLGGETYNKYYNPIGRASKLGLALSLPVGVTLEEIVFRVAAMGGLLWGLSLLSIPILPALIVAGWLSALVFARVHGYGPKLPRVVFGLIAAYAIATHGLLFAAAMHLLTDLFIIVPAWLGQGVNRVFGGRPRR